MDWTRVEMFHLDEYVGLPASHPASFRKYLRERLIDKTGITRSTTCSTATGTPRKSPTAWDASWRARRSTWPS